MRALRSPTVKVTSPAAFQTNVQQLLEVRALAVIVDYLFDVSGGDVDLVLHPDDAHRLEVGEVDRFVRKLSIFKRECGLRIGRRHLRAYEIPYITALVPAGVHGVLFHDILELGPLLQRRDRLFCLCHRLRSVRSGFHRKKYLPYFKRLLVIALFLQNMLHKVNCQITALNIVDEKGEAFALFVVDALRLEKGYFVYGQHLQLADHHFMVFGRFLARQTPFFQPPDELPAGHSAALVGKDNIPVPFTRHCQCREDKSDHCNLFHV